MQDLNELFAWLLRTSWQTLVPTGRVRPVQLIHSSNSWMILCPN